MNKKFCLALLLITAMCLSAAGIAQANPQSLVGTWRMGNGGGEDLSVTVGSGTPEEVDIDAEGKASFKISKVTVVGEGGTLDLVTKGDYTLSVDEEEEEFQFVWNINETGVAFEIFDEDIFLIEIEAGATLAIEPNSSGTTADVWIVFEDFVIGQIEGENVVVTGALEFTAKKDPTDSSSSGGCDTGAGFGLFLALGALAVFKRAKRKA